MYNKIVIKFKGKRSDAVIYVAFDKTVELAVEQYCAAENIPVENVQSYEMEIGQRGL